MREWKMMIKKRRSKRNKEIIKEWRNKGGFS